MAHPDAGRYDHLHGDENLVDLETTNEHREAAKELLWPLFDLGDEHTRAQLGDAIEHLNTDEGYTLLDKVDQGGWDCVAGALKAAVQDQAQDKIDELADWVRDQEWENR